MGLRQLSVVQLGKESSAGTLVAATQKLMGVYTATWHEQRTKDSPEELRQSLARYFRATTLDVLATLDLEQTCTFEELPYQLYMGVRGDPTVTNDAAGTTGYRYLWRPTLTAVDVPRTYSFEVGDNTQAYTMPYGFVRNLEISFAVRERTRLRSSVVGRSLTAGAFTGSLSDRTVEDAFGQGWELYVDNQGGTIGTTRYGGCITGGTWRIPQCFVPHNCIDGANTFTRHQMVNLAPELELTVELDSTAQAIRSAAYTQDTHQLIRLQNYGSNVHGAFTPPVAPTLVVGSAGTPNGTYRGVVTFVTAFGESSAGASAVVTVTNQKVEWTGIPTGPAGTTARKLYRTQPAGAAATARLVTTLADNVTTTYSDNASDGSISATALVPSTDTTAFPRLIRIDGSYQVTDWGAVGGSDQDGVQTFRLTARGEYDASLAKLFECIVQNGRAATAYD
jgi:hypothetical protein